MIRDALQLQIQGTQPRRARRYIDLCDSLESLTVRPREGHGGIPRDARSEAVTLDEGQLGEPLLDAFVDVTETLFESQHLLTHHREAKVSRFNGPCVYGSDGNFMHALTL